MSSTSTIEWTDATWNPVTGCDRVSPGCAHCYALTLAKRLKAMGNPRYQVDGDPGSSGPGFGVTLHRDVLELPFRWRKPRRVFVNSMSDLFHEEIPDGYIAWVFWVMSQCPQHTFQVLTKRPDRMRTFMARWADPLDHDEDGNLERRGGGVVSGFVGARGPAAIRAAHNAGRALLFADMLELWGDPPEGAAYPTYDWMEGPITWPDVPHNVWLGVSIENRRFVGRADELRATPAAVRFISAEPLLGPLVPATSYSEAGYGAMWHDRSGRLVNLDERGLDLTDIDWLIVGGESGPGHRPMREEWVRDLRDAAIDAGTAFFFKQWGGRTPKAGGRELDGRAWDEAPDPLRGLWAAA